MPKAVLPQINIELIISIAVNAGSEIMKIYQMADSGQQKKTDNSPLTEADIASHRFITKQLETITPLVPILSEESSVIPWEERKNGIVTG